MTEELKPIRLGFIGCGQVTTHGHLPALEFLPSVQVVAISDIDKDRLHRVANQFRIGRRYPDFHALLDDPVVDVVAICVPAQLHAEAALAALESGKHLFIEKPLALNMDDSDRLIKRASQSHSKVMVGFNLRRHRLTRKTLAVIEKGTLGSIEAVRSVLTTDNRFHRDSPEWRKRRERGGGEFFETAVHHIDLWRFLLKTEIEEVFATSRSGEWDDETVTITARLSNGSLASGLFSIGTGASNELEIFGQSGQLSLSFLRFDGLELLPRSRFSGDVQSRLTGVSSVLTNLPQALLGARKGGDFLGSYREEWRHFVDCIRLGVPIESTLEDGRRALQAVLAATESASAGRPVKVADAARSLTMVAPLRRDL